MIKEPKIFKDQVQLSCSNLKNELYQSINDENERSNVDSAKKRACLQGMDYDNFRQMVLGANLYKVKTHEFGQLYTSERAKNTFNSCLFKIKGVGENNEVKELTNEEIDKLIQYNQDLECKNFREFRKKFDQIYKQGLDLEKSHQLFHLIEIHSEENLYQICNSGFETVSNSFQRMMNNKNKIKIFTQLFYFSFKVNILLQVLKKSKEFNMLVPKFLSKKEKVQFDEFFALLQEKVGKDLKEIYDQVHSLYQ